MTIFEKLSKEQRPNDYAKSSEAVYFSKHSLRLASIDIYRHLSKAATPFEVIRANIVSRSLENKEVIEKEVKNHIKNADGLPDQEFIEGILSDLPYLKVNGEANYVPILPQSLSLLYSKDFLKLETEPYKRLLKDYQAILVDPFDFYGSSLFDSYFTSLVPLMKKEKEMACYDFDCDRIYFINDEGRLDAEIALFDKKLENVTKTHLTSRLKKVANAYFSYSRDALLKTLVEEKLVSNFLIQEIMSSERKTK